MPQESVTEARHIGRCLGVQCAHIGHTLYISPCVCIFIVETTIVNMFSDQLCSGLVTKLVNLQNEMSRDVRKPAFCICENKDADQLRGNREADQRLCFRYTDSTIPLLPKSKISSLWPSSVTAQPGLCGTRSETPKTGFLTTRLK